VSPEPVRDRPRVLMLVLNAIDGDSRVQKAAWSMANRGWEVTLLGTAPGPVGDERTLGTARVLRVAVPEPGLARRIRRGLARRLYRLAAPPGGEDTTARTTARTAARTMLWRVLVRDADWRRTQPRLLDLERAFAPVLAEVDPDLVHAHDYSALGIAARWVADRRAAGRPVRLVYDAHEYLPGVRGHSAVWHRAFADLERWAVGQADAVVTVSAEIATLLATDHRLPERPAVVANAPLVPVVLAGPGDVGQDVPDTPSVRAAAGVPEEVPLLVYSGAVAPQRGLDTLVAALAELPGAHAVVVAGSRNRHLVALERAAERAGVADRFHVAPYVTAHQVPAYLSSATVGIIPILHYLNHELALITKYYEYLHARLPIVVSDVRAMAAATRELGNGEVFAAGDAPGLAAAVRAVLADRSRYVAAYTDEVLAANTWERAAGILHGVYQKVLDSSLSARVSPSTPTPFGLQSGAISRAPDGVR
jgi:glycogen synthase